MEHHSALSDSEFEQQFQSCTFPPTLFSHEAHLRLAWIHLQRYGLTQALRNIEQQLFQFVTHLNEQDKYHHTLTHVAVHMVHHFIKKSNATHFEAFLYEFPKLKSDFRSLVTAHYSFDIFNSEEAKKTYIAPDTAPF